MRHSKHNGERDCEVKRAGGKQWIAYITVCGSVGRGGGAGNVVWV